jgi:ArsR family transcriptional regulator, arsenate/arsenite/antimonite-responsive transcriptional repressor
MDGKELLQVLKALADPQRLGILKLLVSEPDGMAAGVIAATLGKKQNTLSSHLGVLSRAALVNADRRGRLIIYSCNRAWIETLTTALRKHLN